MTSGCSVVTNTAPRQSGTPASTIRWHNCASTSSELGPESAPPASHASTSRMSLIGGCLHSGFGAWPCGDLGMPAAHMGAALRYWHSGPAGEIYRDQRGDVGDRIARSSNELALCQTGVHPLVEMLHAQASAFGQRRNLLIVMRARQCASLEARR